jgi:hypothetical protein
VPAAIVPDSLQPLDHDLLVRVVAQGKRLPPTLFSETRLARVRQPKLDRAQAVSPQLVPMKLDTLGR